jgi:hypothetical protein
MNKSIGNNYCLAHLPGCHQGHSCQQGLCSLCPHLEVKLAASFQERPWQQAFQLLDYPETDDRQPSVLMEACMTCCRLFLSLFLRSLPWDMLDRDLLERSTAQYFYKASKM